MNILLINKTHFISSLEQAGHRVLACGVPEEHASGRTDSWSQIRVDVWYETDEAVERLFARLPSGFIPDFLVYHDDSRVLPRVEGLERCPVPTVFYSVDAHVHHAHHSILSGLFDKVFVAQRDYVEEYRTYNPQAEWLPLWAPVRVEPQTEKTIEVCFRGSLDPTQRARRVKFLDELGRLVPLDARAGDYGDAFSRAKIIVNEAIDGDLNFRVFEAMMCGGVLLQPRIGNGLFELFTEGADLVTYEPYDATDAAEKIRGLLANEDQRRAIADAGRRLVIAKHTEKQRGEFVEASLMNLAGTTRPTCMQAAAFRIFFRNALIPSQAPQFETIERCHTLLAESVKRQEGPHQVFVLMATELVRLLRLVGRVDEARGFLREALTTYADTASLRALLVDLEIIRGDQASALELALPFKLPSVEALGSVQMLAQKLYANNPLRAGGQSASKQLGSS